MLKIRKAQLEALGVEMAVTFEDRMEAHLQKDFPSWCAGLGPGGLREFVRHGVRQARQFGMTVELDVARYILVMRQLGMRFDQSQDHAWARAVLNAPIPPSEKLDRLNDAIYYQQEARKIRNAGGHRARSGEIVQ